MQKIKKILLLMVCIIFLQSLHVAASDWFVRPAGGSYGKEDGTSYEDAWDGLSNVVWGPGGVDAGDTLYVCGLHLRTHTGLPQWEIIGPVTSGTSDSNRVTIRGDYPSDQGIIWGAGILAVNSWSYEGSNTYSMSYPSSHSSNWIFEDVTATSWTVLDKKGSIQETKNTPGSFYMNSSVKTIYVHTSDNGDPTNRIAINKAGYFFNLGNVQYVTFKNLEAYSDSAHNMFVNGLDRDNANHIRFDGLTKWYAGTIMHFRPGNDNIEFYNSDLAWAKNGLDFSAGGGSGDGSNSPSNCIISGNTIHDIGVTYTDVDAHAVSWQGGRNNLIEKNEMYNCGSTIVFYQLNNQGVQNTTIRWNYIHDSHTLGGANGFGIELAGDGDDRHNNTGNAIYGNIVQNCTTGYRYKYVQEHPFYNNIAYKCRTSFYFLGGSSNPDNLSYNVKMRNDISLFPTNYHIEARTSGNALYVLDSDYNIFYPDTGNKFLLADLGSTKTFNFSGWQNLVRAGCTFDPNSIATDPMFVDPDNGNFNLMPGSPAIDAGVDVGLTQDFEGNAVPQGNAPDIGAFEYMVQSADPQPDPEPEPESDPDPDIIPAQIPDVTSLQVSNNIIKKSGNTSAVIQCNLKEAGNLSVTIYGAKGREIITVCDEQRGAGRHEFSWAGQDSEAHSVGSGIYIVQMKAGKHKDTKKIAVVK